MSQTAASGHVWRKKLAMGCLVTAGMALLLWKTNPSHLKHHAKIWPGPVPVELMDLSPVGESEKYFIRSRHPDLAKTNYRDFVFFSTTSYRRNGSGSSFGLLGFVFDVRTAQQAESERAYENNITSAEISAELIQNMNRTSKLINSLKDSKQPAESGSFGDKPAGKTP